MTQHSIHLIAAGCGRPGMDAYRPYTRALLRRYMRLAADLGRLPSILGGLCFRPKVSSYRVHTFEDAVIFVHDVEHAFELVGRHHMEIVAGVVLLDYTLAEAALRMGITEQRAERRYYTALDELSRVLLQGGLLRPVYSGGEDAGENGDATEWSAAKGPATTQGMASGITEITAEEKAALPPRIPPASARGPADANRFAGLRNATALRHKLGCDR